MINEPDTESHSSNPIYAEYGHIYVFSLSLCHYLVISLLDEVWGWGRETSARLVSSSWSSSSWGNIGLEFAVFSRSTTSKPTKLETDQIETKNHSYCVKYGTLHSDENVQQLRLEAADKEIFSVIEAMYLHLRLKAKC